MAKKTSEEDRLQEFLASELIGKIKKKHGANIITPADDFRIQRVARIPTGIFFLDYALGGGFPAGRVNIVWGHKSTGKTVICVRAVANAQRLCANCFTEIVNPETGEVSCACKKFRKSICAYIDVEGTWDQEWARTHGVDTSRLLLSVPEYAEQTLDIGESLLRSGYVDVLVIDSLAFLTPAKEIEESTAKALQAEQARVVGRGIRKFGSALNYMGNRTGRRPTIFFTNQVRMKLGVMFGSPEVQPAGHSPGFSATTETKTFGSKYALDEVTGRPTHVDLGFRVEKNKSSVAKIEGEWRLMLADTELKKKGDVYDEPAMVDMGVKIGLVETKGPSTKCLGKTYKGKSLLAKDLAMDAEFKKTYSDQLLSLLTA